MNCPFCKSKMEEKQGTMKDDNVRYSFYKCISCKEELLDMPQMQSLAKKYKSFRRANRVSVSKWGNSLAVRIPKSVAQELHLKAGKELLLMKEEDGIKLLL